MKKQTELMGGYQALPHDTPPEQRRTGEGYFPKGTYPPSAPPPPPEGARSGARNFTTLNRANNTPHTSDYPKD